MSATAATAAAETNSRHYDSLWLKALRKFRKDKIGMWAFGVVLAYAIVALGVVLGWWATDWAEVSGPKWAPVSGEYWFGTNIIGQDIFLRAVYSTRTAFEVGLVVALGATLLGAVLGALAGYYSVTWVDEVVIWLMAVLDSMPFILLVAAIAYSLDGNPWAMHIAMIVTFWIGTARLVRGEVIKLKGLEYVEAAHAIGMNANLRFWRVLVPQTARYALPGLGNVWQFSLKDTSLISIVGLVEVMRTAAIGAGSTKQPFTFYITAFLIFLVLAIISQRAFNAAEGWANRGVQRV